MASRLQEGIGSIVFGTAAQAVRKGSIAAIGEDGMVEVRDSHYGDISVPCHVLRAAGGRPLELAPGDAVLYVAGEGDNEPGCILGRVEPYKPKADRMMEKIKKRGRQPSVTTLEDEVVRIKADKGLVIECGKGTIIITEDGKLQIKGEELLSKARRMNRIKGAGINLN